MRKHKRGPAGVGTATWRHHRRAAFASRSTGTTLATEPISRCCPLVPEILNSIPSSMAVELFARTQDTSPPNAFPPPSDRLSIPFDFVHSTVSIPFRFDSTSYSLSFSSPPIPPLLLYFSISLLALLLLPSFSQLE